MHDQDSPELTMAQRIARIDAELLQRAINAAGPRDWPEDFSGENGRYCNMCLECRETFTGYKRRALCKVCVSDLA